MKTFIQVLLSIFLPLPLERIYLMLSIMMDNHFGCIASTMQRMEFVGG